MYYWDKLNSQIQTIFHKLQDDESKELYDARLQYYLTRDRDKFQERITSVIEKYRDSFSCWGLNQYYEKHPENIDKPIIVFGCGYMGRKTIRTLELLHKKIDCVTDNNFTNFLNGEVLGYNVISPSEICDKDAVIMVATNRDYHKDIYHQLLDLGIMEDRIIMYQEGGLFLDFGKQYFDIVQPNSDGEIFVDAGCFDGHSSAEAFKWAAGKLEKVYAFEPDKNNISFCKSRLATLGCEYELFNLATWSNKTNLSFKSYADVDAGYGSCISHMGDYMVAADSIDNILNGRKVTYIKLDVEGSELKTLQGAIESIRKWRPKLAISIYHKPEDVIELFSFVESLNLDYQYYIRQYQSRNCETTLYAL